MNDIILERLKEITTSDYSLIYFFDILSESNIPIEYHEIELLYLDFIYNFYSLNDKNPLYSINSPKKNSINNIQNISFKISLSNSVLSVFLEDTFDKHLKNIEDDFLLFYKKDEDKILILFKSFFPLDYTEKVSLPYYCFYIDNKDTIESLNKLLNENENENFLCINCK